MGGGGQFRRLTVSTGTRRNHGRIRSPFPFLESSMIPFKPRLLPLAIDGNFLGYTNPEFHISCKDFKIFSFQNQEKVDLC